MQRHGQESGPTVVVRFQRELEAEGLPIPSYATPGASGMDLSAALPENSPLVLGPGERVTCSTGLRIALPQGYEAQIRPRSGLAIQYGIGIINSPGTIDADYRGVIQVILINHGLEPFTIRRGDRIAQIVIVPVPQVRLVEGSEPDITY